MKKILSVSMWGSDKLPLLKELLDGRVPTRMELFTYMEDDIYQLCIRNSKENPFRRYFDYRYDLGELSQEDHRNAEGVQNAASIQHI